MRGTKMTAFNHVREAHTHLLLAYSMVDAREYYTDTINRGMRACATAMGQMPCPAQKKGRFVAQPPTRQSTKRKKLSKVK